MIKNIKKLILKGKWYILTLDLKSYVYYIYKVYSEMLDLKSIIRFIRRGLHQQPSFKKFSCRFFLSIFSYGRSPFTRTFPCPVCYFSPPTASAACRTISLKYRGSTSFKRHRFSSRSAREFPPPDSADARW